MTPFVWATPYNSIQYNGIYITEIYLSDENISAVDAISALAELLTSDSATHDEFIEAGFIFIISDTATGQSQIVITVPTDVSDSGAGESTVKIIQSIILNDIGAFADSLTQLIREFIKEVYDSVVGSDELAVQPTLPDLPELVASVDTVGITQSITLPDNLTHSDKLSMLTTALELIELLKSEETQVITATLPEFLDSLSGTDYVRAMLWVEKLSGQLIQSNDIKARISRVSDIIGRVIR